MEKVTTVSVDYITIKRLAKLYPYLRQRQIENVLSAAGVKGIRGKGVPLGPALKPLFEYAYSKGQKSKGSTRQDAKLNAEQRLKSALADLREMEYAEKRGKLVRLDAVELAMTETFVMACQQLEALGGRVELDLAGISDPARIRSLLLRETRAIRTGLANGLGVLGGQMEKGKFPKSRPDALSLRAGTS